VILPARGRAGGKVILLGEHAVVYGRPALAAGIGRGLAIELRHGRGPCVETDRTELADDPRATEVLRAAAELVGLDAHDLVARVTSDLPPGMGLGSSAALSVAVLRACAQAADMTLSRERELDAGRRLEALFHGTPSGVDPAAAALGLGCFRFVRGEPPVVTSVRPGAPLGLVVAFGARSRSTGAAVGGLRERWLADRARYERVFDEVAVVVEDGVRAVAAGDAPALGRALDRNQALLEALGVSSAEVEATVGAARTAGALGAKLTGGGAGGAVIALAADALRVASRLEERGIRTFTVALGDGVEEAA
jgi:mevalonate kinase